MEFRHIYYFIKTAEYGNISKAADALFISQQALSKSLKQLEHRLGVRLLIRAAHGIRLTEDGLYIYRQFHSICEQYDTAVRESTEHLRMQKGIISFSVSHGFFRSLSIDYLIDFNRLHPDLTLEQLESPDLDCEDYVRADKKHFALSTKPHLLNGLEYYPLHREQLYFIAHKAHPFADRSSLSLCDLVDEGFLIVSKRYNLYYNIVENCRKHHFMPHIIYYSSDVSQLVKLAAQKRGCFICVKHVYEESAHENLVCIPITDDELHWELGIICQEWQALSKNQQLFIDYLLKEIAI